MPKNITSVEWSATGVPSGVSFNTQTGTFSGTPEAGGKYTVPVHVETNYGEDTKDVVIEIESAYPVYAIGARAHTWSEGAEADSYGFRKLNMPKATRLFDLYGGFAATTPDGMYVCGIEAKDVGLEGTDFGNPTTPKRLPIDDVEEMYGGLCYSAGAAYKSTAYKLSNGNAYAVGQGNSTGRYSITDGSVLSVPRVLSYNQYIAATAKGRQGIITGMNGTGSPNVIATEKEINTTCSSPESSTISASNTNWIYYVTPEGELRGIKLASTPQEEHVEFPYGRIKDIWSGQPSSKHDLFVVTEDNKLYARGTNSAYYLGLPTENSLYSDFTEVGEYAVKKICVLTSPYCCAYLLTEDGELYHSGYIGGVFGGLYEQNAGFTRVFSDYLFKDISPSLYGTNATLTAMIDDRG